MGLLAWLDQRKAIKELQDDVAKLVRIVQDKDLDWSDMRARCKRLLDRTEKAAARANPGVDSTDPSTDGETANLTHAAGRLSDHQREIQQKILRRRAGLS
jgi:chemotaxis regulatin CheY-phosphate phosphatase CheZ